MPQFGLEQPSDLPNCLRCNEGQLPLSKIDEDSADEQDGGCDACEGVEDLGDGAAPPAEMQVAEDAHDPGNED